MIVRERYMQQILDVIDEPVIKVITGVRRCGKSVLLKMTRQALLNRGVRKGNIVAINFESLYYEPLRDYRALY